jgi:hypothetical protein
VATNLTNAATSFVVAKRCKSELGRAVRKNSLSISPTATFLVLAMSEMDFSTPSERVVDSLYSGFSTAKINASANLH